MGIPFTVAMGFLLTATMGKLFTMTRGIQLTISSKIAIRLKNLMYEACRMNSWWVSEMSIQDDHLHIVLQISPKDSVADVVQIFKGGTSRVLRKEFPELEEFLWGDSFWADGYFAETVGQVNEEIIKRYIRQQGGRP